MMETDFTNYFNIFILNNKKLKLNRFFNISFSIVYLILYLNIFDSFFFVCLSKNEVELDF